MTKFALLLQLWNVCAAQEVKTQDCKELVERCDYLPQTFSDDGWYTRSRFVCERVVYDVIKDVR